MAIIMAKLEYLKKGSAKNSMQISLAKKMVSYFLLVVFIAAGGFLYIISNCTSVLTAVSDLEGKVPRMQKNNDIAFNALSEASNLRGYLLYKNDKYLIEFKRVSELNTKLEDELIRDATSGTSKKLAEDAEVLDKQYSDIAYKKLIPLEISGDRDGALSVAANELAPLGAKLLAKLDEAKVYRTGTVAQAMSIVISTSSAAINAAKIIMTISALLGILIGLFAARRITSPLKMLQGLIERASNGDLLLKSGITTTDEVGQLSNSFNSMVAAQLLIVRSVNSSSASLYSASRDMATSSLQVSTASSNISETIQRVAQSMEDAAVSSTETSQVLLELSALIQIAKDKAASATDKSNISMDVAKEGKLTVSVAIDSMNAIHAKTLEAEKVIALLNEYSKQIGVINSTITGIATQTNLLALNAAIEAARAGEAGKGFAVVAEEVRKLAEQSTLEASNVSSLIFKITENTDSAVVAMKGSLAEVEIGVKEVNKAGKSLDSIITAVAATVNDINAISSVTADEVASSDKIIRLIEVVAVEIEDTSKEAQEVASAVEETSASIDSIAANSEETVAMAQNLHDLILKFKIE